MTDSKLAEHDRLFRAIVEAASRARSWEALERVEDRLASIEFLSPLAKLDALAELGTDAVAGLVTLQCSRHGVDALTYFSDAQLTNHAVAFLRDIVSGKGANDSFEHEWAWWTVWYGELSDEERLRLVLEIVRKSPDSDLALWMIADGPLSAVAAQPGGAERLEAIALSDVRLRETLHMLREG